MIEMIGIVVSGILSYWIARFVHARARLTITLERYIAMDKGALGKSVEVSISGKPIKNLVVLKLSIESGRVMGVNETNIASSFKPSLRIKRFRIVGIRTLNNNRTMFDIPIGKRDDSTMILNINWIRHNVKAEFLVAGTLEANQKVESLVAEFFPGMLHGVDIRAAGFVSKDLNTTNFEKEIPEKDFRVFI